jgi:iron complex outermembrane receptor protein
MPAQFSRRALLCAGSALCSILSLVAAPAWAADDATDMPEMTITGTREGKLKSETPAAVTVIGKEAIDQAKPAHPMELMNKVPGAAIMVTNGEGHTTGIRHPIGTSQVYLYLEDGIPTRAPGFFNHNALFEVNLPQSGGIEVTRGPGSALHGSDAIGAVFNTLSNPPSDKPEAKVTAEGGSYGWGRVLATASNTFGDTGIRGDINGTHTDGWRRHTLYDRQSATFRVDQVLGDGVNVRSVLTGSNIDMETGAGARLTKSDYLDNPTENYHSIAWRRVRAMRASISFDKDFGATLVSVTPFVRSNYMDMNPSYSLSSDPSIQLSGHSSLGVQAKVRHDFAPWRTRLIAGTDFDYTKGFRDEERITAYKSGNYFRSYSRGPKIYNYDVDYMQISPYLHAETSPVERLRLEAGLRLDLISFDYHNHMDSGSFSTVVTSTGTTRTFYRPNDATRYFSHLSPSFGVTYSIDPMANVFGRYKHSFRTPGEGDLFRSGTNQDSIHLKPVTVNTYEIGLKGPDKGKFSYEIAAYTMLKQNDILSTTASSGTPSQSNNGKTLHRGVELGAGWQVLPEWKIDGNTSYSIHKYRRWMTSSTVGYNGMEIPSAPRVVSNAQLTWTPDFAEGLRVQGEWTHIGPYKMDDANSNTYRGHHLFNLHASYAITGNFEVFGRMMNVMDERWATSAVFTNSREEFSPGLPRTLYGGLTVRF